MDWIRQMSMADKWSILRGVKPIILLTKRVDIACHVSGIIFLSGNGKVEKVNSNSLFEEQNVL